MTKITDAIKNGTYTENGDFAYNTTGNDMTDILFFAPFLSKNLKCVDNMFSGVEADLRLLFAAFMRDPRFGMGYKDLGRHLLKLANASPETIANVGRFDDLWRIGGKENIKYLFNQVQSNNALAKKWCPRFGSKNKAMASLLANTWGMSKQQYGKFVKVETVEKMLTERNYGSIDFGKLPSLAAIKYGKFFANNPDTQVRYEQYKNAVRVGAADLKVTCTTPYDVYKNRDKIDADLFFDKLEKIKISCMPIIDVSGSMYDSQDSIGKALSIGHYLAKCSTYENGKFITFTQNPDVIELADAPYVEQFKQISRSDWGYNTDFGKVMRLLSAANELPDYLVVLTDMQFDSGSANSKQQLQSLWKQKGYKTKIVWWNFNSRGMTTPEMDDMGNIFMSGYNPSLLQYLESGFDAKLFIYRLLQQYRDKLSAKK